MSEQFDQIGVRIADWDHDLGAIRHVRDAVFVAEQQVDPDEEWDDADPNCLHVIAETQKCDAVGTGRLDITGKIGRMAVLKGYRGTGVGTLIMQTLIEAAKDRNLPEVYLNAQTHAVPFYTRHGFAAEGEEFLEANIPHVRMRRQLTS
jgi:predicted GNAT family N-acyltransferase